MPVENVSISGLFLRTAAQATVGTRIGIALVRRGLKKMIVLDGSIVNCVSVAEAAAQHRAPGLAVKFAPYPLEVEKRLVELLEDLSSSGAFARMATLPPVPAPECLPAPAPAIASKQPPEDVRDPTLFAIQPIAIDDGPPPAPRELVHPPASGGPRRDLEAELLRAKEELEQQRKLAESLRSALTSMRGELLRLEQDNAELTSRLARYES